MVTVAVAGGTGGLGRAIVEALNKSTHKAIILSRNEDPARAAELGAPIVAVDYDNVDATAKTLEDHSVNVVISTLAMRDDSTDVPQQNLIRAAEKSSTTKRFVPSEWGLPWSEENERLFPSQANRRHAVDVLKNQTKLEYALFIPGFFTDYFGTPKLKSYTRPFSICIDIANRTAALPGDGTNKVVFSYTFDIAKYVVRYLDVPEGQWEETVTIASDTKTFNQVLEICEKVTGEKFKVTHDSVETLEKKEPTELPSYEEMYSAGFPKEALKSLVSTMKLLFATDQLDFDTSKAINKQYPDIKPKSVEDVVKEGWGN